MAIRIDENTIFEDGRMKKISKAKEEPKMEDETEEEPKMEAETEEEPKTEEAKEEPKPKAGRKPKTPIKGKEA